MGDFYPGINEPLKPLKLPMTEHQYYDSNVPAFRRDDPSPEGQLWLDTKVNFLNEIMKFLPRSTTNSLTKQELSKDNIKDYSKRMDVAESVYNTDVFEDQDIGLWKGNQSTVLDKLFSTTGNSITDFSRFAGLLGLPFDGHIGLGTYIVNDEENNARPVTFMEETADGEGTGIYYMEYTNKKGAKVTLDITTAEADSLIPILKDLKGDTYAKNFREGVNFHATVLDFQNTNASYDNEAKQFVVDANGDGFADGVDTNNDGTLDTYDSLSTTALNTNLFQSEYLNELGVYSPVLDYSDVFSDFMSGSLFNTDSINQTYTDADRKTYDKLQSALGDKETAGEFKIFMDKIKFKISKVDGEGVATTSTTEENTLDYIPNIFELARKGIDFNEVKDGEKVWSDKDIFYMSMLMIESKRRYTYAMSSIFGVNNAKPDVKDVLTKYTDPDIWQCDPAEDYLYIDVCTGTGRYERMYNYFIPMDVGQNITDPNLQKIEKLNWLNKRSIEYLTNDAMYTMYQDAANAALKDNNTELVGLKIDVTEYTTANTPAVLSDFNSVIDKTNSMISSGQKLNETQLAQLLSLVKEAKDWLLSEIGKNSPALTTVLDATGLAALNTFLTEFQTSTNLTSRVNTAQLEAFKVAYPNRYTFNSLTGILEFTGTTTKTTAECTALKSVFTSADDKAKIDTFFAQNASTTLEIGANSTIMNAFLTANPKFTYNRLTGNLTVTGEMKLAECTKLKTIFTSSADALLLNNLMNSSIERQNKYTYDSLTGELTVNGTMTEAEQDTLEVIFHDDVAAIGSMMKVSSDKIAVLTGGYTGDLNTYIPGSEYKKADGSKIYYVKDEPISAEANKWNEINEYITKINDYAGKVLTLKDEAGNQTFIEDYLNNSMDISKATLYKIGTDNTLVEDTDLKKNVISNCVDTMSYYFKNYSSYTNKSQSVAEMEKVIDLSFDVTNNTGDLFSILSDTVNNQAKIFNDINNIDKFHYINYGTVRNVYKGEDATGVTVNQNLYEKGILDLGYYPEEIAKTTAQSPYMNPNQVAEGESFIDGTGNARYQTNMVDKMYFSMIAEMQKMNNFYMMQMFASPDAEGNYNFLDPLKVSSDALVDDKRAYLQSKSMFVSGDTTKGLLAVGAVSENSLADSMDIIAENIYPDLAAKLTTLGVFQSAVTAINADKEETYYIATVPPATMTLPSPYDVLSEKLMNWLSQKKAGDEVTLNNYQGMISIYSTQILFAELQTKDIIDDSGYILDVDGVRILNSDTNASTRIDALDLSGLSPLFSGAISKPIVIQGFKDIVAGKDYVFSEDEAEQTKAASKRNEVSTIIAGAVEEDYTQIKKFVGSLYTRMSDIDFQDTGTVNNSSVVTTGFSSLDFTNTNEIPSWMEDDSATNKKGYGTQTITGTGMDPILKTILENEGILLETSIDSNTYKILQGIDPKIGLTSFNVLIREGYTNSETGVNTPYAKATIDNLINTINEKLLGTELSTWLNGVKNIEYNAFDSKLKVNTKDTVLSLLVSRDFVTTVSDIKKYHETGGFNWVDNATSGGFTSSELNSLWTFVTKNIPSNIIPGTTIPTTLTATSGVISYEDLDMVKKVIDMLEAKWSTADNITTANPDWKPGDAINYVNAVNNNTVFEAAAQADWPKVTASINSQFGASDTVTFNPELSSAVSAMNFTANYTATYTWMDGNVAHYLPSTSHTGTISVAGDSMTRTAPSVANKTFEDHVYVASVSFTSVSLGNGAYPSDETSQTAYKNIWALGSWGGDLSEGGYSYLPGTSLSLADEYARDFTDRTIAPSGLSLTDYDGDGTVNDTDLTVYEALLMIRDRASANIGYLDIQQGRFNSYATQVKDMLMIGGTGVATEKEANSLEKLFTNEFYMKDNFDPLILGAEFQSRYVEGALVSSDGNIASNADALSMTNTVGWYETAGRVALNSTDTTINNKIDFAKFSYAKDNDYNSQYATVKAKMSAMKYDGFQDKDNIRSTMERASRDEFGRTLAIGDLVLSNSASNVASFKGGDTSPDIKIRMYNKDGSGVALGSTFFQILANVNVDGKSLISLTDIDRDITDRAFTVNTEVITGLTFEQFKALDVGNGKTLETALKTGFLESPAMDDAQIRQLYDFLSNIGWNNVAIGANLSTAHSIIELNSIYMEVILARIMISVTNDELNTEYERRKAEYDDQISKKRDDEVSEQIADSKRSAFKSYLKSISRKK